MCSLRDIPIRSELSNETVEIKQYQLRNSVFLCNREQIRGLAWKFPPKCAHKYKQLTKRLANELATEIVKVTNKLRERSYLIIAGNFLKSNWYLEELYYYK
jgi:hypothetical protein